METDRRLLDYYLALKSPEAAEWNLSPECLYAECMTRDYVRRYVALKDGIRVCNVGIGTGDWDDYLGYWLNGTGTLTSIDMDPEICSIFSMRQHREGHPNRSMVKNQSIFAVDLPPAYFDLVTLIGSTVNETGDFDRCIDACMSLLKQDGCLLFMAHLSRNPVKELVDYAKDRDLRIEQLEQYDTFSKYPFYICKLQRYSWQNEVSRP